MFDGLQFNGFAPNSSIFWIRLADKREEREKEHRQLQNVIPTFHTIAINCGYCDKKLDKSTKASLSHFYLSANSYPTLGSTNFFLP